MAHRLCPWWLGYFLASPLRRLLHDPDKIVSPYVREGMTVLDAGPGMGFFSLPMARMVGKNGKVLCIDVQEKMLRVLRNRAARAGLAGRIETRVSRQGEPLPTHGFEGRVDFALLFAVVHEVEEQQTFLASVARAMKPGATCLLVEPKGHVKMRKFQETLAVAGRNGLIVAGQPHIFRSQAVTLKKEA